METFSINEKKKMKNFLFIFHKSGKKKDDKEEEQLKGYLFS